MSTEDSQAQQGVSAGHSGRLLLVVGIAWFLCLVQFVGAILTGSLALLFDTVHVLTDALGLTAAFIAARLATRPASHKRTWGWKRVEVISAMFQAAILLGVGAFILVEALERFFNPSPIPGREVLIFGLVGLAGNVAMVCILAGGDRKNFNMRAAFLEVINDALGSCAVIISAGLISLFGWYRADALLAILIAGLIIPRTLKLLQETLSVLLESTPKNLDLQKLQEHLEAQPHVLAVHDLHASQIASDLPVLTAHVVLKDECFTSGHSVEILKELQHCVHQHFEVSIRHSTFQLEPQTLQGSEHYANLP